MDSLNRLRYHAFTGYLFVQSNQKDTLFPVLIFALATAHSLTQTDIPCLLARLPLTTAWLWLSLLAFCIHNQRHQSSIHEDSLNKPWRPIPSGRITAPQADALLFYAVYPVWITLSYALGVGPPCATLEVLYVWYHELGGGDTNPILRNGLNAAGYASFMWGAVEVLVVSMSNEERAAVYDWLILVCVVIGTTIQIQDFRDEEGDRARGRTTLQHVIGSSASRWTVVIAVSFWSVVMVVRLRPSLTGVVLLWETAKYLVNHVLQSLKSRTVEGDKSAYRAWCLWLTAIAVLICFQGEGHDGAVGFGPE